jgi:dCTP deaminase
MILSDKDIKEYLRLGKISVTPYRPECLQPASIDLHLDRTFLIFDTVNHYVIDVRKPLDNLMRRVEIADDQPFILHPGEFALGATYEEVGVGNDVVGRLEGKSSLGRLGIIIHATAGYLDPGNRLKLTLELSNIGSLPVMLFYNMPIAQMSFSPLSSACETPYGAKALGSKYYGAQEPQASQMWKNFTPKTPAA